MSSSSVWVQLYYELEKKGSPEQICESDLKPGQDWNVASFRELVKDKRQVDLNHCDPARLVVYPPHTVPPFSEQTFIRGDKTLKELIDELGNTNPGVSIGYDHPLIVVAPAPAPPPAPHPPGQGPLLSEEVITKMENSVCVLREKGIAFGCGFAVSNSRVYTAAHHWEEEDNEGATYFTVKVGSKVECIHGKPSDNKRYNLQVVKLDKHLDYCILEIIGDHTFTEWLESDGSPNLALTTPVFLAAYQIGIQERLDEYEMRVTLGITTGTIVQKGNPNVVHSCTSFKGDSGGAIVISNGKVIGLHLATVNKARELLDVTSIDFGPVADSINQLCDRQSSGSVALLVSAINP